jgi:hypothetical protein
VFAVRTDAAGRRAVLRRLRIADPLPPKVAPDAAGSAPGAPRPVAPPGAAEDSERGDFMNPPLVPIKGAVDSYAGKAFEIPGISEMVRRKAA